MRKIKNYLLATFFTMDRSLEYRLMIDYILNNFSYLVKPIPLKDVPRYQESKKWLLPTRTILIQSGCVSMLTPKSGLKWWDSPLKPMNLFWSSTYSQISGWQLICVNIKIHMELSMRFLLTTICAITKLRTWLQKNKEEPPLISQWDAKMNKMYGLSWQLKTHLKNLMSPF